MPSFRASARIEGLDPLVARLRQVKGSKGKAVLKRATAKGAKVVLDAAKANLRGMGFVRKDSLLLQSLGSKVVAGKKGVYAVVGPRTGFKKTKAGAATLTKLGAKYQAAAVNPVRYAHLVEKGRKEVVPVKAKVLLIQGADAPFFARRARAVQPRPFLMPALESNRAKVADVMGAEIGKGLVKLAKTGAA